MSFNNSEVHLAPNGHVYLADAGTAVPTAAVGSGSILDSALHEVGYIDDKGASITPKITTTEIRAWQAATPVKVGIKEASVDIKFTMIQLNGLTGKAYWLDQSFVVAGSGVGLTLPAAPTLKNWVLVLDWLDEDGYLSRFVSKTGMFTDRDALTLDRSNEQKLGVTFNVLADDLNNIGYFYSARNEYLLNS
jgi:hypothetical protein